MRQEETQSEREAKVNCDQHRWKGHLLCDCVKKFCLSLFHGLMKTGTHSQTHAGDIHTGTVTSERQTWAQHEGTSFSSSSSHGAVEAE